MDKKKELISIIKLYENGQADLQLTLNEINQLTGKEIDEYTIRNYWTYTSLDNFCDTLLTEPITDWQKINDETALLLIKEILADIGNEGIIGRNGDALEKKYNKKTGFVSNLIFYSTFESEKNILEQLKKDTTIYL